MKNYFELLNLNIDASREEILEHLNSELKKQTRRANHFDTKIRAEAEEMVKIISEAIDIFKDEGSYKNYLNEINPPVEEKVDNRPELTVDKTIDMIESSIGTTLFEVRDMLIYCESMAPNYKRTWYVYARYCEALNDFKGQEEACRKLLKIDPNDYWAHFTLFKIYRYNISNTAEARKMFEFLYNPIKNKETAYAYYYKTHMEFINKNFDEALKYAKLAKKVSGNASTVIGELSIEPYKFEINSIEWDKTLGDIYYWRATRLFEGDNHLTSEEDALQYKKEIELSLEHFDSPSGRQNLETVNNILKVQQTYPAILPTIYSVITFFVMIVILGGLLEICEVFLPKFIFLAINKIANSLPFLILLIVLIFRFFFKNRKLRGYDLQAGIVYNTNPYKLKLLRALKLKK